VSWAKEPAYDLLQQSKGEKNPFFFFTSILDENQRPILKKRTWQNFLEDVRNGKFPQKRETLSG